MKPDIAEYSKYLLVIAHPDDEVNCAVLLHRLVAQGKQVKIILLTNGDAGANSAGRVNEMLESAKLIGLAPDDLIMLAIPEKELLSNMTAAYDICVRVASDFAPDCILSLDYEGGHEGHDTASFIAHQVAITLGTPHFVFPDYHFRDSHRHGLEFQPDRQPDYTLNLNAEEKNLIIKLLEAHRGQLGFYLGLQKNQDNYFKLLFEREIFRVFPDQYDFLARPSYQIGYEHHRNGFKFTDFVSAARPVLGHLYRQ